jgi:hypothetical protein
VLVKLKYKDIKTKKFWAVVRSFFKKPIKKKIVKIKKPFFLSQFFFSLQSFLVPFFSFRGNSGFAFKFFSKIISYSKLFLNFEASVIFFEFLSKLLLPFDFRQKKKSGKALFLPMLINMQSQYSVLFRLFLKRKVRRSYSFFIFFLNTLRNSFLLQDNFYFQYKERASVAVKHLRFLRFR